MKVLTIVNSPNFLYSVVMKSYTVKELYKILGRALKNLPFMITYHGKPRAVVLPMPGAKEDIIYFVDNKKFKISNEEDWSKHVKEK